MTKISKWILFTGTWRIITKEIERDVRNAVRDVIKSGNGVLTGGATGVDYIAMDEALKINPDASQLKVIIPAYLDRYIADYYKNWCQKPITRNDINSLASILGRLKKIKASNLIEMSNETIMQEHYDLRSEREVINSNEVYVFQANNSRGAQHTLDYATKIGIPITIHKKYSIKR